jgi:hypothetical protein
MQLSSFSLNPDGLITSNKYKTNVAERMVFVDVSFRIAAVKPRDFDFQI